MATAAKARAAKSSIAHASPPAQVAAAPARPEKPKQKKGFATNPQPDPTQKGPHKLGRPGMSHKGAGSRTRPKLPRRKPTPEKLPTTRGELALHNPEVAGGALAWTEHFAAQAGLTQEEVAAKMGVDPKLFRRNRQRKDETGGYDYIEPNNVGASRLLDEEMEAALCWYIENVDARLTLDQYAAIAASVEGLEALKELKGAISRKTVQRTITEREEEKGHMPITDEEVHGTQKRRKKRPRPGTDGSVDLSRKQPRVRTHVAAARPSGVSVRQSQPDRDARRRADRLAAQAQD